MRASRRRPGTYAMILLCAVAACSRSPKIAPPAAAPTPPSPSATGTAIPAGKLIVEHILYEFAVYYLPEPTKDPLAELTSLLRDSFTDFQRVDAIADETTTPSIWAELKTDAAISYPPPDARSLQYFGRGLSQQQADALGDSKVVLVLAFAYSKDHAWDGMRAAVKLTDSLARATGGVIWDAETRELFAPDAWKQRRIDDWTENIPDISKHTTIHAYRTDEFVRAITLGMAKFGLPDIVVDNFSWSRNRNVGHLVNLFAQAIAEGATPQKPGEFDLDVRAIKNANVREPQLASLLPNATGVAPLSLREGTWEEGDPRNRLIEITFDRCPGPDAHARQEHLLASFFGSQDSVAAVKHDDELEETSRRARTRLPALREAFNKGFAPGEYVYVKAPFETPDGGREWMWVEVSSWRDDKITGLLQNDPSNIPDLRAGQTVEVSEAKVFDYIHHHADGTTDGNETGKVIQSRNPEGR